MSVDVVIESGAWVEKSLQRIAETTTQATLRHLSMTPDSFEIVIMACDDARIADLNRDFRDKPTPTNVLSWPSEERSADVSGGAPIPPTIEELGDIADIGLGLLHRCGVEEHQALAEVVVSAKAADATRRAGDDGRTQAAGRRPASVRGRFSRQTVGDSRRRIDEEVRR